MFGLSIEKDRRKKIKENIKENMVKDFGDPFKLIYFWKVSGKKEIMR